MRFRIFIIALAMVLSSCEERETTRTRPEDVLEQEAFVQIMTDVQILDAGFKQKMYRQRDPEQFLSEHYAHIFETHGVSRETFIESYEWWAESPDDMVKVYEAVIENISEIEANFNRTSEKEKADQ